MTNIRRLFVCLAGAALFASAAAAQSPAGRVRGTIESLSGQDLKVVSREGPVVAIRLADNVRLSAVAKATLADIKAGSYVGIAALPRPDGTQMALEVLIFPEAMRGAGEGHRPWDLMPESTMTNATVADTVQKVEGHTLTLTYKDGQKTIVVPPEAPIVTFVPAERADLKPGTRIFTGPTRGSDGVLTSASVVVGKDGVDPPM
jgi:hypothetical protein